MNIPWADVQLVLAIADAGSLSGAAKKLRLTQPTVSRKIAAIESSLGEALFARTVEGTTPTSFGERLLEPARRMAEWAAEVSRTVEKRETKPSGVVRITAPPGLAFDFVAPFAQLLKSKLPEISLEVISTIAYLDLSRRDADLALRFAAPAQRDVSVLAKLEVEVAPFASDTYVKTLPRGYRVADVAWIGWAPPLDHLSPNLELKKLIPGFLPSFASDDFIVQLRALDAGLGAMFLGRVQHRFSRPAPLTELRLNLPTIKSTIHLAGSNGALAIPRVRAVADLLARELERTVPTRSAIAKGRKK